MKPILQFRGWDVLIWVNLGRCSYANESRLASFMMFGHRQFVGLGPLSCFPMEGIEHKIVAHQLQSSS
jgi:hypothetical protein